MRRRKRSAKAAASSCTGRLATEAEAVLRSTASASLVSTEFALQRSVAIGKDHVEQRLFLLPMGATGGKSDGFRGKGVLPSRPAAKEIDGTKGMLRPAAKRKSQSDEPLKPNVESRDKVASALADFPFVLKAAKTRCRDLISVVSSLARVNKEECRSSPGQ